MHAFAPRLYAQGLGHGVKRERDPDSPLPQLTSKDGAVISMGADVQFRVWDPVLSVMMVKDLIAATRMTAQNAMTKTLVKKSLREIQVEKLRIGEQLLVSTAPARRRAPPNPQALGVEVRVRESCSCWKSTWPWSWPRRRAGKRW